MTWNLNSTTMCLCEKNGFNRPTRLSVYPDIDIKYKIENEDLEQEFS